EGTSALAKVLAALPDDRRREVGELAERVWVRAPAAPAEGAAAAVRRAVDEALRTSRVVVIDYVDGDGASTTRRPIEPLGYARTRGTWYVMAWCRRRRAGRWFRVERIQRA